jgi:uncharacterized membrane protein
MNHQIVIVFLCYSLNPFIRKIAITQLNDYTGYALIQFTTMMGNVICLVRNQRLLELNDITLRHLQYSMGSSALTVLSSYYMTRLLKENSASSITSQIQVLTIITSFIVDYLFNDQLLTNKQVFGIFLMVSGIVLSKN